MTRMVGTGILVLWLAFGVGAESSHAELTLQSLTPPVLLPDGTEFRTWEQLLQFTRTFHVDNAHPKADDANPGTVELPWRTIGRAAELLQAGERVVVAGGIYRECVRPARGGSGPERMISYEAAPGARVIIQGSNTLSDNWQPSSAVTSPGPARIWSRPLEPALFNGYYPFSIDNVTPEQFAAMDWAAPLQGTRPYTLPRGLVFDDGRLLRQVGEPAELLSAAGVYWVDRVNQVLHVRLHDDRTPQQTAIEITVQPTLFAPAEMGLGFIRVKGFTFRHVGGPFPFEQIGAISTTRGHHWIIEENAVSWVNGVGIDIGRQHPRWPQPPVVGFHIVRRNVLTDIGICGIAGLGPGRGKDFGLLIEDNVFVRNAFHDVERLYETAAIKTHNNVRCLIRRNLIVNTLHGPGIWMDFNIQFSRCTQNVIVGTRTIHGAIFVEASYQPNLIDQNVIFNTTGHGIYEHDSTNQAFAHNLIAHSSRCGLHLHGKITDRRVDRREMVYGRHTVHNNVLIANARDNEYLGEPSDVSGNVESNAMAQLDLEQRTLAWTFPPAATDRRPLPGITHDLSGRPRDTRSTIAGPFDQLTGSMKIPWPLAHFQYLFNVTAQPIPPLASLPIPDALQ
jgi:hypothetical protein